MLIFTFLNGEVFQFSIACFGEIDHHKGFLAMHKPSRG